MVHQSVTTAQWKIIFLSSLGGMLEFYDFVIFAVFALPIGETFFPNKTPLLSVIAAFAAFAIGYLARPIGGIIFSHFGDKYGRKRSFILTIIIMGSATFLMGILPSYHAYGFWMSIIFILLRIIQGIAVGGEIPGAITFVAEHVERRAGFACGIVFLFINLGIFLADFVNATFTIMLKNTDFYHDAWRFAFFIGGFLAIISYFLRSKLSETPVYLAFEHKVVKIPFFSLIKSQLHNIIMGILIVAIQATLVSLLYLYVTQYMELTKLYTHTEISMVTLIALGIFSTGCAFWGWVADFIGYKRILSIGMLLLIIFSYGYYAAMLHNHYLLFAAIAVAVVSSMITGSFSAFLTTLFPTAVRFSGIALCYNIGFAIFGGLTPLIASYLIHQTHDALSPSYIVMLIALIGLIGVFFARKIKEVKY